MNKLDSAKLQFYRRQSQHCSCTGCASLIVRLEVDFGSLLPEIDAERALTTSLEVPLEHWFFERAVNWVPRGFWASLLPMPKMEADEIVQRWIARARAHILGMTGREILVALESGKSIEVPIDKAAVVIK